jgi:hypothetical protein
MMRNFLFAAFLAVAAVGPGWAAPIPLLDIYHRGGNLVFGSPEAAMQFEGSPRTAGQPYFDWEETYGVEDVGTSDWADATILAGASEALAKRDDVVYLLGNVPGEVATFDLFDQQGNQLGPPNLPCHPELTGSLCLTFHVTDMLAYNLVALERIVQEMTITPTLPPLGPWVINAVQTIRYWGEPVPESSTLLLSFFALHSLWVIRVRL